MINLSISNIAWAEQNDCMAYKIMQDYGFYGLEIAPTRIFKEQPYEQNDFAKKWANELYIKYGFHVTSMQSIWYGRTEKIFGDEQKRGILEEYTKRAIDFAETIGCKNLVFGCPRNRCISEDRDYSVAIEFFKNIGEYAVIHNTCIGMEANPPIYNTNFINNTKQAISLVCDVGSAGFKLNLDIGTIIENSETITELYGHSDLINHVHISEPGLGVIKKRRMHFEISDYLRSSNYKGAISIEMGCQEDMKIIQETCAYVREVFG